tara:strand:+ start:26405 stop:27484 length:1080 start_codon:yes stop_codon:yes gene_type:complete
MAKRKRLPPANPNFLSSDPADMSPSDPDASRPERLQEDVEPKGHPLGVARTRNRPPIAQVAGEASAASALNELTDAMTAARIEGRLVQSLALSEIDTGHLVRDRLFANEEELGTLIESLRKRGQQTPIEVVDRGKQATPRYGLISGWRRLAALSRLVGEDEKFDSVLALIRSPKTSSEAYVAMVEENEIRVGLSYYERARIAVKAVEQGVYTDLKAALNDLFANVSRAKRSKIKSFTILVEALDGTLRFPTAIGERLGLDLAKRLESDDAFAEELRARLTTPPSADPEEEQARLAAAPNRGPDTLPAPAVARLTEASAAATPAARVRLEYNAKAQSLILKGPGVTPALRRALEIWLRDH